MCTLHSIYILLTDSGGRSDDRVRFWATCLKGLLECEAVACASTNKAVVPQIKAMSAWIENGTPAPAPVPARADAASTSPGGFSQPENSGGFGQPPNSGCFGAPANASSFGTPTESGGDIYGSGGGGNIYGSGGDDPSGGIYGGGSGGGGNIYGDAPAAASAAPSTGMFSGMDEMDAPVSPPAAAGFDFGALAPAAPAPAPPPAPAPARTTPAPAPKPAASDDPWCESLG